MRHAVEKEKENLVNYEWRKAGGRRSTSLGLVVVARIDRKAKRKKGETSSFA